MRSIGEAQRTAHVDEVHSRERVTGRARLRYQRRGAEPHGLGPARVEADQFARGAAQQEAWSACAVETQDAIDPAVDSDGRQESCHPPRLHQQLGRRKDESCRDRRRQTISRARWRRPGRRGPMPRRPRRRERHVGYEPLPSAAVERPRRLIPASAIAPIIFAPRPGASPRHDGPDAQAAAVCKRRGPRTPWIDEDPVIDDCSNEFFSNPAVEHSVEDRPVQLGSRGVGDDGGAIDHAGRRRAEK
jgi:hypothetical protein